MDLSIVISTILSLLTILFGLPRKKTFLKPVKILFDQQMGVWFVTIRNMGENLARDIKVRGVCVQSFKKLNTRNVDALGPMEIRPGEVGDYQFNRFLIFSSPVQIKWSTLSNHKQSSAWSIIISKSLFKKDIIECLSTIKFLLYNFLRYFHNIFNRFRKDHRLDQYPILKS